MFWRKSVKDDWNAKRLTLLFSAERKRKKDKVGTCEEKIFLTEKIYIKYEYEIRI